MPTASGAIAIVTPSYAPDLELCRLLNRSVLEFLPASIQHFVIVNHEDLPLFRGLAGERTTVLSQREFLPSGMHRIPGTSRWVSRASTRPFGGWLVQQVVKLAVPGVIDADCVVCVDSDVTFVRPVDDSMFVRDGRTRFFRRPGGVTDAMADHVVWQRNAARMLGVEPRSLPAHDYISSLIVWDARVVEALRQRVEQVTGRRWVDAVLRAHRFSEYLLYGAFVDDVLGDAAPLFVETHSGCHSYWEAEPLVESSREAFVRSFGEHDVAVHLQSISGTGEDVRAAVIGALSGGRLP